MLILLVDCYIGLMYLGEVIEEWSAFGFRWCSMMPG